jgi:hypothetical protein
MEYIQGLGGLDSSLTDFRMTFDRVSSYETFWVKHFLVNG